MSAHANPLSAADCIIPERMGCQYLLNDCQVGELNATQTKYHDLSIVSVNLLVTTPKLPWYHCAKMSAEMLAQDRGWDAAVEHLGEETAQLDAPRQIWHDGLRWHAAVTKGHGGWESMRALSNGREVGLLGWLGADQIGLWRSGWPHSRNVQTDHHALISANVLQTNGSSRRQSSVDYSSFFYSLLPIMIVRYIVTWRYWNWLKKIGN